MILHRTKLLTKYFLGNIIVSIPDLPFYIEKVRWRHEYSNRSFWLNGF